MTAPLVFAAAERALLDGERRIDLDADETAVLILLSARPGHWFLWSELASHARQYGWPEQRCAGLTGILERLDRALAGTSARLERGRGEACRLVGDVLIS